MDLGRLPRQPDPACGARSLFARTDGISDTSLRLSAEYTAAALSQAIKEARLAAPIPDPKAVKGLKFSDVLPEELAADTMAERLADYEGAAKVLHHDRRFTLAH